MKEIVIMMVGSAGSLKCVQTYRQVRSALSSESTKSECVHIIVSIYPIPWIFFVLNKALYRVGSTF